MRRMWRRWLFLLVLATAGVAVWYRGSRKSLPEPIASAFRHALSEAQRIPDWNRDFALEEIVEAQARAGDITGAETTLHKIEDSVCAGRAGDIIATRRAMDGEESAFWKRVRSWLGRKAPEADKNQLVAALAAVGRWGGAQRVAETIDDPGKKSGALRDIAIARVKAGDLNGAAPMAVSDALGYFRPFVLLNIADAEIDRKDYAKARSSADDALTLAASCDTPEFDYQYYRVVAWAARERNRLGDHQSALDLLSNALRRCMAIRDAQARSFNVSEILETYASVGEFRTALALAKSRLDAVEIQWAYRLISSAIAKNGNPDGVNIATRIRNPIKKDQALRGVALAYAHRQDFKEAMRIEKLIADPMKRQLSAHHIAAGLARAGRIAEARAELSTMQPSYDRPRALQDFCRILARSFSLTDAMREASAGATPVDRAYGYIGVSQGCMDRDRQAYPSFSREDALFDLNGN